jgi:hypothetical protein
MLFEFLATVSSVWYNPSGYIGASFLSHTSQEVTRSSRTRHF